VWGSALIRSTTVWAMRDLPIPGSPEISTTQPSPRFACLHRRMSRSISSSRPTSGVLVARNASNRLSAVRDCLKHALHKAGAPQLMTPELIATLSDHAQGNYRTLMNMAGELLVLAAQRGARQIDEKLFLETYAARPRRRSKIAAGRRR